MSALGRIQSLPETSAHGRAQTERDQGGRDLSLIWSKLKKGKRKWRRRMGASCLARVERQLLE